MYSNTKLLVTASLLILSLGSGLLWFGLQPFPAKKSISVSTPTPIASDSQVRLPKPGTGGQASPYVATSSASPTQFGSIQGVEGERAQVSEVIDGDTIKVSLQGQEQTVRFVGMDTPETLDPRRPVGCFGKEASNETKKLLTGKVVILQKDVSNTDKYKRLLRYVYLPIDENQTLFVNDYLVRMGFAKVYTYPPDVKFNEQFRQAEKEARENKRGLWGRC